MVSLIDMIKHHEGVRFKPYRCPALLWTIGVGHVLYPDQAKLPMDKRGTVDLNPEHNRTFSASEVDAILDEDLKRFRAGVAKLCPGPTTSKQFDAMVSFAFNVGLGSLQKSTIRMKHNRGEYAEAADEFLKWTKAGGKVLPGLVKRRNDERAMYLS